MTATFGLGVYTAPEAARMIGMRPVTLRRWVQGYEHHGKVEEALWQPQYGVDEDGLLLGFRDLVEGRIVHALRAKGFGLPTVRICIERARQIVGDERPFSTRQFKTDGKSIFLEITEGLDEPELIDLKRRQGVFRRVVAPSLIGLEFDDGAASRWWLLEGKKTVVADPERAFGQPIVAETGVTTARLEQAVRAEGSVAKVAKLFETSVRAVRDALSYQAQQGVPLAA